MQSQGSTRQPVRVAIIGHLASVAVRQAARAADPMLAARVQAIKAFQQRRFAHTYADLLQHPRYASAARFFLEELYGPADFTQRDAQFARVVPALVRLFPPEVVATVETLAALHALSELFDDAMAQQLRAVSVDAQAYAAAWRVCGDPPGREHQIALMLQIGRSLDTLTRNTFLRHSLRMMRAPARAAGLTALHAFLESGFDTFRALKGADEFLALIAARERDLAARLFSGNVDTELPG